MLYAALAWSSRRALRWCYRDVAMVGRIPASGPVLLAVNHPNDLSDICVVLGHVRRRVHFVANVSAAEQPLVAWAYARMGVVPIHRVRDARKAKARGEDSSLANERAFAQVRALLSEGACVCVFPEGGVHRGPHLGSLRTGLARMALDARETAGVRGIQIVPVGLTYEAPLRYRSRVLIEVGAPILLDEWVPDAGRRADSQLTGVIGAALRGVTRNAPDEASARALRAAAMVCGAAASDDTILSGTAAWRSLANDIYGPGIALEAHRDPRLAPAAALVRRLETLPGGPTPELLLGAWSTANRNGSASGLALLSETSLAMPGLLLHAPAWRAVRWVARASASAPDAVIPRTIVPGLQLMVAWYVLLMLGLWAVCVSSGLNGWISLGVSLLAIASAPTLGDAAMRWLDRRTDRRLVRTLRLGVPDLAARVRHAANAASAAREADPETMTSAASAHNEREVI